MSRESLPWDVDVFQEFAALANLSERNENVQFVGVIARYPKLNLAVP